MRRQLHILLLLVMISPLMAQVAVVNASVPNDAIDIKRMAAMLLGRVTIWSDGSPVVLVLAADPLADVYLVQVTGRERQVLERGWKRLVFAGAGAMPLTARSAEDALLLVAATPGAVVLLDQAPTDPRWRVIALVATANR